MYWKDGDTLVSRNNEPKLSITAPFESLLETLPQDCPVPTPIVKFGLLTQHVEPSSDEFKINFDKESIGSSETAVVPAETLSAVEYLLYNHSDHLSTKQKQRIGRFCEVTQLDYANKLGASESTVKDAVDETGTENYPFIYRTEYSCDHCGDKFDSKPERDSHTTDCGDTENDAAETSEPSQQSSTKKRPALGKEIRKDKGSERVSGRNPFADTDRLKDTGLHQGGGN
ncbi:hypothetical protein ABNG03_05785 [Halorubrum sp. RMP-47]|uniref:hypothetical protein n=1 Tax=Halorubrum miltondacostae TaxID=3076378 RepID=UPI0035291BA7